MLNIIENKALSDTIDKIDAIKAEIKDLELKKSVLEDNIKSFLNKQFDTSKGTLYIYGSDTAYYIYQQTKTTIDRTKLAEDGLLDKYAKVSTITVVSNNSISKIEEIEAKRNETI